MRSFRMAHPRTKFYSSKMAPPWTGLISARTVRSRVIQQRWFLARDPDPFQRSVLPTAGCQPDYRVPCQDLQEWLG
jgi:hypothetical protein